MENYFIFTHLPMVRKMTKFRVYLDKLELYHVNGQLIESCYYVNDIKQ